jgi:hypothetical protein
VFLAFRVSCNEHNFGFVLIFIRIQTPGPVALVAPEHKFDFAAALAFAARATGNRQQAIEKTNKKNKNTRYWTESVSVRV